jgi:hypothetical protein
MRYEVITALTPGEAFERAIRHFGPGGGISCHWLRRPGV